MTLKQYLSEPGRSATLLATELGVSVSTITRAANGETIPSRELMKQISQATDGEVGPNDFYGIAA